MVHGVKSNPNEPGQVAQAGAQWRAGPVVSRRARGQRVRTTGSAVRCGVLRLDAARSVLNAPRTGAATQDAVAGCAAGQMTVVRAFLQEAVARALAHHGATVGRARQGAVPFAHARRRAPASLATENAVAYAVAGIAASPARAFIGAVADARAVAASSRAADPGAVSDVRAAEAGAQEDREECKDQGSRPNVSPHGWQDTTTWPSQVACQRSPISNRAHAAAQSAVERSTLPYRRRERVASRWLMG